MPRHANLHARLRLLLLLRLAIAFVAHGARGRRKGFDVRVSSDAGGSVKYSRSILQKLQVPARDT
jgi:hypothetical protein